MSPSSTCEFCQKITRAPPCAKWSHARSCPNFETWILARVKNIPQLKLSGEQQFTIDRRIRRLGDGQ